jgi:hypothetical protein
VAIENVNSTLITSSFVTVPGAISNAAVSDGVTYSASAYCAVAADASQYSTYRFFSIPSNAVVHQLWLTTDDDFTGVTAPSIGVANRLGDRSSTVDLMSGGVAVAGTSPSVIIPKTGTHTIFGNPSLATAVAAVDLIAKYFTIPNQQKRVWEVCAAASDYRKLLDVVVVFNADNTGNAGNIGIKALWSV